MIKPRFLVAAAFVASALALPVSAASASDSVDRTIAATAPSEFDSKALQAYMAGKNKGQADAKQCLEYNATPPAAWHWKAGAWKSGYSNGYWGLYESYCLY